jgi:outer membrane protein assembly factor BamB
MPNGDVKWRFELSQNTTSKEFSANTVTLGPGGAVYVPIQVISRVNSDQSLHLYALGPDGSLNWDVDIGATTDAQYNTLSVGTPAVSLDGSLVFVSVAEPLPGSGMTGSLQYMVAVTAKGVIKWHQTATKTYQSPYMEPVVNPRDGLVYISGSAAGLSALVPDSGQVVWPYTPPRADEASTGFASDGKTMLVSEFLPG